jgi:hypothetical protein
MILTHGAASAKTDNDTSYRIIIIIAYPLKCLNIMLFGLKATLWIFIDTYNIIQADFRSDRHFSMFL